jgi:hypothetical protein
LPRRMVNPGRFAALTIAVCMACSSSAGSDDRTPLAVGQSPQFFRAESGNNGGIMAGREHRGMDAGTRAREPANPDATNNSTNAPIIDIVHEEVIIEPGRKQTTCLCKFSLSNPIGSIIVTTNNNNNITIIAQNARCNHSLDARRSVLSRAGKGIMSIDGDTCPSSQPPCRWASS